MAIPNWLYNSINQGFVNSGSSLPYPLQASSAVKFGTSGIIGADRLQFGKDNFSYNPPLDVGQPVSQSSSAGGVSRASVPPSVIDYLNADLAKHYGLSKETAYQEALSNTAYQRAVADMKAAGLNPAAIFGSGKGYTAGGVSYVSSPSRASGGGATKNGYLFSEGAYHAISTAAGLVGAAITKLPTGYWIGQSTAQGVMGALNSMFK